MKVKPVALIDMDGTLVNYDEALERDMAKLASPDEPNFKTFDRDNAPAHIKARIDVIRDNSEWWENLEPLDVGMFIYQKLLEFDFRVVVLTQGPRINAEAWKGKLIWCRKHLEPDTDVIITRDKGLVYGKILVDDWPPYVESWLAHRPRGKVIMPNHPWNQNFEHPNVMRFNWLETNLVDDLLVNVKESFQKQNQEED